MRHFASFLLLSCVALGCQDREPVSVTRVTSIVVEAPAPTSPESVEPREIPVPPMADAGVGGSESRATPSADEASSPAARAAPTQEPRSVANVSPLWTEGAQESNPWTDGAGVTPGWTNGAGVTNDSTAGATVAVGPTPGWTNGAGATNDSASGATVGVGPTPGWTNGSTSGATLPPPPR